MLALGAISESAISAAPDEWRVTFAGVVTATATSSDDVAIYAGTEDYISRLADTPAGQPFRGTMDRLPQFDRSILGGDGFSGMSAGYGDVQLINAEGDYDDLIGNYAVDGREVNFYAGDPTQALSTFFPVANLLATSLRVDGQFLTVGLQDKSFKLNVPSQPNVFLGTGELEGGTELAGKRRPLAFGRVKNATPVLLIAGELVYQVSDGAVSQISAVYDTAYPLTATSDYATPALLRAATIAGGSYATCLAYGMFRLGAPASLVTCDTRGDATNTGYVETTGTIIRRIIALTDCLSDPDEIDENSFSVLEALQPAPIGYYLDSNSTETVKDTFDKLTKGIGASLGFTRLGMLQIVLFTAPAGAPAGTYTDHDIIGEIEVEALPSAFDPPPWRQRVAYDRNWTVIDDPLPGALVIDADRGAWVQTPYRVAATSASDGNAVLEDHLQAQDPAIIESYFALAADALAFAESQFDLKNSGYRMYRILFKIAPFTHDICEAIRVTDRLERLGFGDGKLGRLAGISDIPNDNSVEVRMLA